MSLYERFESAANEIQSNFLNVGKRAFAFGNNLHPFLSFDSEKFIAFSSLPGLKDMGFKSGGFYSYNDLIIMTTPIFKDESIVDVQLRATGVRILQLLGINELFLFGLGESLQKDDNGERMFWANDHINLSGINPLVGENIDEFGARFPDMTTVYDNDLTATGKTVSEKIGYIVEEGVWAAFDGKRDRLDEFSADLIKNSVKYFSDDLIIESIAAAHGKLKVSLSLLVNPSKDAAEKLGSLFGQLNLNSN